MTDIIIKTIEKLIAEQIEQIKQNPHGASAFDMGYITGLKAAVKEIEKLNK